MKLSGPDFAKVASEADKAGVPVDVIDQVDDDATPGKLGYVRCIFAHPETGLPVTIEVDHLDRDGNVRTADEIGALMRETLESEGK
jgi:hypothetical protein